MIRLRYSFSRLSAACLLPVALAAPAQGQPANQSLTRAELGEFYRQGLSLLPQAESPAAFATQRCGTGTLIAVRHLFEQFDAEQQQRLRPLFSRPLGLPDSYVSQTGHFRIHYTTSGVDAVAAADQDGNAVPDYVENIAAAFDLSFSVQVDELGYRPPPDDGDIDGAEYDIYIQALADGFYGLTTIESPVPGPPAHDWTSFIRIDNDYLNGQLTPGLPGAQVTAAHELFHAIQLAYRTATIPNDFFYYELCSSWMEDVVYDDINDYYFNVPLYLDRVDAPFNRFDLQTLANYGAAIWNQMLTKRFNSEAMIRRTWESMESGSPVLDAIDLSLREIGSSLRQEFAELAVWNYFTAERANPVAYFEEGAAFPQVKLALDRIMPEALAVEDSLLSLAHKYHRVAISAAGEYILAVAAADVANIEFGVIRSAPGTAYPVLTLVPGQVVSLGDLPGGAEVLIVVTNHFALDGQKLTEFDTKHSTFRFTLELIKTSAAGRTGVLSVYPNPFRVQSGDNVSFEFSPQATTRLIVRVLNSQGQVVRRVQLAGGGRGLSGSLFRWDGRDDGGELVASGVYILQLQQGNFTDYRKFAVVRE